MRAINLRNIAPVNAKMSVVSRRSPINHGSIVAKSLVGAIHLEKSKRK